MNFSKMLLALAMVGSASAFMAAPQPRVWGVAMQSDRQLGPDGNPLDPVKIAPVNTEHVGKGGMVDTRDPEVMTHEDPRKSISAAPSFEEYMKQRS